jgi:hypothetical protein
MVHQYEQTGVRPIDGSNAELRALSPFVIQVEPPLIFGSEPGFLDGSSNDPTKPNIGIYRSATKGNNGFMESRQNLANSSFATANLTQVSVDEILTGGGVQHIAKAGAGSGQTLTHKDESGSNAIGKPSIADLQTAVDIAQQLQGVLETPPLVLLINPESMDIQRQRIQQYSDRTRFGYVFHAWGQEQIKLSITAKCGAFVSGGRGVQYASKRDSASWQNLMAAFQFYRNNGYIHDTVGKSYANHFVGALSIQYDQWTYYGNMESFNWTHDSSNELGGVSFTMEFTANRVADGASQPFTVLPLRSPNPNSMAPNPDSMRGNNFDPNVPGANQAPGIQNFTTNDLLSTAITSTGAPSPAVDPGVGNLGFRPTGDDFVLTFEDGAVEETDDFVITEDELAADAATLEAVGAQIPPEPFRI